jgi:hypothetical protein
MPNQRDIIFSGFKSKVDHDAGYLMIKQGSGPATENGDWHITRQQRIGLRSIVNCYLEGPFGCYGDDNEPHDDCWHLVFTCVRCLNGVLYDNDVVIRIYDKDQAQSAFEVIIAKLGF